MSSEGFLQYIPQSSRRRVKNVREDTGTEINYAELTWSNRQILCDSLQNNLDAETRKFVAKLEERHITDGSEYIKQSESDPKWRGEYLNLLHLLHTLSVRAGDLEPVEKDRLIQKIHFDAAELNVSLHDVDDRHFQASEAPNLPVLVYAVKDIETGKVIRNLSQDDILSEEYSDMERFSLFEWRVEDSGGGYDATKSVLYLPTKKGEKFSRGMFGEGLKVNQAAIARTPGVNLRIHSQFEKEDGSPVAWVRHIYPEENQVMQRGRELDQRIGDSTGSGTTIRFVEYRDENKELRKTLDPRITNLGEVATEFSEHDFSYPLGITEDGFVQPGVSVDNNESAQFLQGLRIGNSSNSLLFSYDFQNRDILAGRDRNHLQNKVLTQTVKRFWENIQSPVLCREFLQRVVFSESNEYAPEREVFFEACRRLNSGNEKESDKILLKEWLSFLHFQVEIPNYIAAQGDGRISKIDENKVNIIQLGVTCDKDEIELLIGVLKLSRPDLKFLTPQEVVSDKLAVEEKTSNREELTEKQQKFSEDLNLLFSDVSLQLEPLRLAFSTFREYRPIETKITYKCSPYLSELKFGIEVKSHTRYITCYMPRSSDDADEKKIPDLNEAASRQEYTAKLFELYFAATMLGQGTVFSDNSDYNEYAQMSAQELLDRLSISSDPQTGIEGSLKPLYHRAIELQEQQFLGREQKKIMETLEAELQSYKREAYSVSCGPERILEIMKWCRLNSQIDGAELLRWGLSRRVIIENGVALHIDKTEEGEELVKVPLTEENRIGSFDGMPEYKISDKCFVTPVDTQDRSILRLDADSLMAICGEMPVFIDTNEQVVVSGQKLADDEYSPVLDKGCIISWRPLSQSAQRHETFHSIPQERDVDEPAVITGIVKSPVTLEYISEHWSDPVRIFQDLGQNHMDAGGFNERFLVLRENSKEWVSKEQLGDSEILGYELSDHGLGYSPSGIHTMGHTRKRNPFLTGKNGEGLKLAAASAKKQGFDIAFASFGKNGDGEEVAWEAEVGTTAEEYTHDGKTEFAQRLIFNVKECQRDVLEGRSASTQMILPDYVDEECLQRWSSWMSCVDPRIKDDHENGGLERFLLTRDESWANTDTVGPTTALLNRPGEIFENGTLIRTEQQTDRRYTMGWNFPSITSTRERTHIDEEMAQAFIIHYFQNTTDERAVEHLLKSIQPHDIDEQDMRFAEGESFSRIIEVARHKQEDLDVSPSWALDYRDDYPSLGLFQEKARELYPGKTLFSYEVAKRKGISMNGSMRHIRPSERLNVSGSDYMELKYIFPTMEDYLHDVKNSIIEIDPLELEPLRNVVSDEIIRIEEVLARLEKRPETATVLDYVLKTSNTTREDIKRRLAELLPSTGSEHGNDVFVMADDSKADGLAYTGIGLRVSLLNNMRGGSSDRLYGVIDHELAHKMLDARDYSTEFVLLLGLIAQDRLRQRGLKQAAEMLAKLQDFDSTWSRPETLISSLKKHLAEHNLTQNDIGTSEGQLDKLWVSASKRVAIKMLESVRVNPKSYEAIDRMKENLNAVGLSIEEVGSTEEELIKLVDAGVRAEATDFINELRSGSPPGDYGYNSNSLRSALSEHHLTLEDVGTSDVELGELEIKSAKLRIGDLIEQIHDIWIKDNGYKNDEDYYDWLEETEKNLMLKIKRILLKVDLSPEEVGLNEADFQGLEES